jgi:hypothetical protein
LDLFPRYFIQATARTGGPELATDSFFKSRRVSGRENEKDYVLGGSRNNLTRPRVLVRRWIFGYYLKLTPLNWRKFIYLNYKLIA